MKRYTEKAPEFFTENRSQFIKNLKTNSVAIFTSGDLFLRSADANHDFFQNPDLYYLTGIDQEETFLVLYPDSPNPNWREVLFIKETSETIKIWEGQKYTQIEASNLSGIKTVLWNSQFENTLNNILNYAESIYINLNEHDRAHFDGDYADYRLSQKLKTTHPLHHFERSAPILSELRTVKKEYELDCMQKACDITRDAFVSLLKNFKSFKTEYEIEAFITYEFNKNKATHAYTPIIASGENSCVLHYNDNNKELKQGDIILFDFGAFYSNYCADMSRTIPISGKFSPRQKDVYNACLGVFKQIKSIVKTGVIQQELQEETLKLMRSALIDLKLVDKKDMEDKSTANKLISKYYPHGIGHFLGLNVHDVGSRYAKMPSNTVITCEPGIYILDEKIGVRIENNLVLNDKGCKDLLETCPIEVEEIEDLMNQ